MRTARSNGFVLTTVIVFLGLMAVVLLVLNEGTQIMLGQTDRMYLAAVESNLVSSGAAWAATQITANHAASADHATELDAKTFSDRPCTLSVRVVSRTDDQANIRISTSCTKAAWTLNHSHTYAIPVRQPPRTAQLAPADD